MTKATWVYYYRGSEDADQRFATEEKMFDKDVVFASRFFRCVKVDVEKLAKEDPVHEQLDTLPAFMIKDLNGKTVESFSGRMNPRLLLGKLATGFKAQYRGDLKKRVRDYVKTLDAIETANEKISALREYVAELRFDLQDRKSAAMGRELKKAEQMLAKEQKKLPELEARQRELMQIELAEGFEYSAPASGN